MTAGESSVPGLTDDDEPPLEEAESLMTSQFSLFSTSDYLSHRYQRRAGPTGEMPEIFLDLFFIYRGLPDPRRCSQPFPQPRNSGVAPSAHYIMASHSCIFSTTSLDPGQSLVQCDGRHGLTISDQRPLCSELQNKPDYIQR